MGSKSTDAFISVVLVADQTSQIEPLDLANLDTQLSKYSNFYEVIVVDSDAQESTLNTLCEATSPGGLPNIQVFSIKGKVNYEEAQVIGLEKSLGDFVVTLDPDALSHLRLGDLMTGANLGADVVLGRDLDVKYPATYVLLRNAFSWASRRIGSGESAENLSEMRLLSRRVVNYILETQAPEVALRHLQGSNTFSRLDQKFNSGKKRKARVDYLRSVESGVQALVSSGLKPLRLLTVVSLLASTINLVYSGYVIWVGLSGIDKEAGWASLALQQSIMFLLLFLGLAALSEYLVQYSPRSANQGQPLVIDEHRSAEMSIVRALNVDESGN
jgi:polyisoprenyl-phosphate glycosyltransferase